VLTKYLKSEIELYSRNNYQRKKKREEQKEFTKWVKKKYFNSPFTNQATKSHSLVNEPALRLALQRKQGKKPAAAGWGEFC